MPAWLGQILASALRPGVALSAEHETIMAQLNLPVQPHLLSIMTALPSHFTLNNGTKIPAVGLGELIDTQLRQHTDS
jgi:hypothetical protein